MVVRELIEILKNCDPESLVVLASDAEQNFHHLVTDAWVGSCEPIGDGKRGLQCGLSELTEEDKAGGWTEADVIDGKPAVILVPSG